ncbi:MULTISPECIES: GtrA family protein [unclassified Thermosynechococcus]|uniref:GtrA family protein n=1 Tax=unclassified Thermosynechococcus TaxID=2622553 RepID=UPI0028739175|nr:MULTISPECIES: GtrA family protein [unclassified Thermosynechococcus]WNC31644.1 GtrA family protein [Thermosynechococcus sp. PKX95]WNC34168.1 GtrA family protein [Thermosynechococcus sp. PKX91]WNC36691.1 GtrA family protein [Thermosynechococcus sp. WL11]WNC39212.1 GtrA family protein [Thermosynechococcus sp. WL17]WNC41733.1 GtrA family protein [Thermosynechococcus sp. WL15]
MSLQTLIIRYTVFAVIATFMNLFFQRVILLIDNSFPYFITAVAVGTLVGLVVKYYLDKRWIFFDHKKGAHHYSRQFSLYASMGIFTTTIFWGFETVFWLIWQSHFMREIGAIIGLAIGYVVKYHLDKRYVFSHHP